MPTKATVEKAKKDRAQGKSGGTQAGEFVREEMEHIREGTTDELPLCQAG